MYVFTQLANCFWNLGMSVSNAVVVFLLVALLAGEVLLYLQLKQLTRARSGSKPKSS